MSHSPPNYMDGVPVKISERFKPPPKIVLPQGVVNRLNQYDVEQVLHDSCYEGELEDTVLKRVAEWKAVKERERYERKTRLQVREQERARLIEQEQKQKLNQISYPNTDELSSASDDNDADEPTAARTINASDDEYEEENDESAPSGSSDERTNNAKPFDHMSQLSSILVPTVIRDVVPSAVSHAPYPNVLVKATTTTTTIPKTALSETAMPNVATFGSNNNNNNNNYNKINYSDFENDTSSPFDNMELRTINDLDILAQVLKQNATLIASPTNEVEKQELPETNETKDAIQPVQPSPAVQSSEQRQAQPQHPAHHNPSPVTTNPYSSTAYTTTNQQYSMYPGYQQPTQTTIASAGVNEYLPSPYSAYQPPYSNYGTQYETTALAASCYSNYPSSTYHVTPASQNHQSSTYSPVVTNYAYGYQQQQQSYVTAPSSSMASGTGTSTYAPSYGYSNTNAAHKQTGGYYTNYQTVSTSGGGTTAYPSIYTTATGTVAMGADAQTGLRSKSRSVPDIMRQLDDEVQDSATRRTRNNSQTIADRQTGTDQYAASSNSSTERSSVDYTIYNQLTQTDQNIVKRISNMGFPLERVVWVLKRIGNDDKKIVEHLIPLNELLDLGFEGEKISDALLKFDNNKHKALDYLIS
ncbi:myb-like protein Q [Anopheles maculipalpis]|uniref:myb-like protein Q n=1 Tax=Anopheles maculipalpis TaxID=1496333 RepID=UPI002158BE21|nr:myb-like protein Q [Anopheles maculipalpis]